MQDSLQVQGLRIRQVWVVSIVFCLRSIHLSPIFPVILDCESNYFLYFMGITKKLGLRHSEFH